MNKLYHPDIELIKSYVDAQLEAGVSLLISSHLSNCKSCQQRVAGLTNDSAKEILKESESIVTQEEIDSSFDELFSTLEQTQSQADKLLQNDISQNSISFKNKTFTLPSNLSFAAEKELNWKEFGNNCGVAQITESSSGGLYFIYMGPGETVPKHGHSGKEYSYVVDGYYYSEGVRLKDGDFSIFDESDTHSPTTASDEGCLVISYVEDRLNFFQGLLAPLNRLLWWYLKRS